MFVCSLSLWNKYVCTTLVMLKKTVSMLFTFQQTYLHFLGMEMMGSSREITVGWLLLYTPKPKSHHNYFQKEFWISFQLFLKVLAHTETILLLLLTQHWEHKFGESPMHHQIVFQNALNWWKLNHQHISKFMESDFYVFKDKFLHSTHCFAHQWMPQVFGIFNEDHTAFKLGKSLKNLCSSHCPFSKSLSSISPSTAK